MPRNGSGFSTENTTRCRGVEWNSTGSVASEVMSQMIGLVVGCWRLGVPVI